MIKWKGYAEIENTWEPAENLQCYGMIQEFEEKYKLDARPFSKYRKPNPAVSSFFAYFGLVGGFLSIAKVK